MANTIVDCFAPSGLTLTLKLYAEGSDTEAASVALTEATNRKGYYKSAAITAALTGFHSGNVVTTSGSTLIASGCVYLADTALAYFLTDQIAGMPMQSTLRRLDDLNDFDPAADAVANVTLVATTTTNTDMRGTDGANTVAPPTTSAIATAVYDTQMTESYAADGVAPTLSQSLYLIQQGLLERSITDVTETVKKLDGTTTAATFTLNDAVNPTSKTRAT